MPFRTTALMAGVCLVMSASLASAQTRTGATTGAQTGAAASTGSTSAASAASAATGSTGITGGGGGGGGATGGVPFSTGNQPTFNAGDGTIGDQIGQNDFVGQGSNGFVGRGNAGQNARNSLTPQFGSVNDSNGQVNRGNTGRANVKRARPQQRIAFTYPKANLAKARTEISQRFKRRATVSGADTSISDDGVATLTGTVTDDESRKFAEALTRLEPGVRSVVNDLRVEPAAP